MSSSVVLGCAFLAVIAWHLASEWMHRAERARLLNAIVARHAPDFVGLEAAARNGKARKERADPVEQIGS